MYYLYVLQSLKDDKFYTGFTPNLKKRLGKHVRGEVKSTKNRLPVKLVYYEAYLLREDAVAREKYLKTSMGKRILKKQLKNFINLKKFDKIKISSIE